MWRVPGLPRPVVVKYAPPHVARDPSIALSQERILFEARCLHALGPHGPLAETASSGVRAPALLDLDERAFVIVMEDVGDGPHLGEWIARGELGRTVGRALGHFLGDLHVRSHGDLMLAERFDNQAVQATRAQVQYQAVEAMCREAGLRDAQLLGKAARDLGERLQRPGRCLVMGDLWPPSLRMASSGLRIIDWELAHYGNPAQDFAHLAAHLWMGAHTCGRRRESDEFSATLQAFLEAYSASVRRIPSRILDREVLRDAAVHIGAEILIRTVGPFQDGSLYDGLTLQDTLIQEAVAFAAEHIRDPSGSPLLHGLRA